MIRTVVKREGNNLVVASKLDNGQMLKLVEPCESLPTKRSKEYLDISFKDKKLGQVIISDYKNIFTMDEFKSIREEICNDIVNDEIARYLNKLRFIEKSMDTYEKIKENSQNGNIKKMSKKASAILLATMIASQGMNILNNEPPIDESLDDNISTNGISIVEKMEEAEVVPPSKAMDDTLDILEDFVEVGLNTSEEIKIQEIGEIDFTNIYTDKADHVISEYKDIITKHANTYGIDPKIMMAIATQERGWHSSEIDAGGAVGLMQIQYNVWAGEVVRAYNYEALEMEKLSITDENIRDLDTNIKIACMYFQGCLEYMDHNIPAALQAYNWGMYGAENVIEKRADELGISLDELLSNHSDTSFLTTFKQEDGNTPYSNYVMAYLKYNIENDTTDTKYQLKNRQRPDNEEEIIYYNLKGVARNIDK